METERSWKSIHLKIEYSCIRLPLCDTRSCDLRITEKYIIAREDQKRLLNKRTEFISKCRHRNKFLLKNVK